MTEWSLLVVLYNRVAQWARPIFNAVMELYLEVLLCHVKSPNVQ